MTQNISVHAAFTDNVERTAPVYFVSGGTG